MQWATGSGAPQPLPRPRPQPQAYGGGGGYAQEYAPQPQPPPQLQPPQLPPGWEVQTSRSSGEEFYHNTLTGFTTFDFPAAPADSSAAAPRQDAAPLQSQPQPEPEPEVEPPMAAIPDAGVSQQRTRTVPRGMPSQPAIQVVKLEPLVRPAASDEPFSLKEFLAENPWHGLLAVVLVFAIVIASVGGACLDDTLIGVDGCDRTVGTVMLVIGCCIAGLVVVGDMWWYFAKHVRSQELCVKASLFFWLKHIVICRCLSLSRSLFLRDCL
jgi:hypothetical protein